MIPVIKVYKMNKFFPKFSLSIKQMLDFLLKNPDRDQEFIRLESQLPETEMNHLIKFTADNVMESVKMLTFVFICLTILNGISPEISSRDIEVLAIAC